MSRLGMILGLLFCFAGLLPAQTTFGMRNTDPTALFVYWIAPGPLASTAASILGALPLAPGGRHPVAPGERVQVTLPDRSFLVGVFVPWTEAPTLRTQLEGGIILPSEAPERGTLLVDRLSFHGFNRGRLIPATLQEWGLSPSSLVLEGRFDDWAGIPVLIEWGPAFTPKEGPWPEGGPRVRTLQIADRDGVFWLRLTWDGKVSPGTSTSLMLRRPGAALEWPLTGADARVWSWEESGTPRAVGSRFTGPGMMEAMIPWDRLSEAEATAWGRIPATWLLVVSGPLGSQTYELGSYDRGTLP